MTPIEVIAAIAAVCAWLRKFVKLKVTGSLHVCVSTESDHVERQIEKE